MKNKSVLLFLITILSFVLFTGCKSENVSKGSKGEVEELKVIKITTPSAPQSIPLFYMKEKNVLGNKVKLDVQVHKTGQEAIAKTMKEEVDMATFGVQEAAKLYNKEVPIKLIDVSNWSTFKIMTSRDDIKNWEDLKGKKVWLGEKGGPIDFLTRIIMKENGINPKSDLEVKRLDTKELSQMVMNNLKDIDVFILREPFISQVMKKNQDIKCVFDLGKEYEKAYNKKIPQGGTVVTNSFIEKNKDTVVLFEQEYKKAIQWVKDNPEEASKIAEKYMNGFTAEVLESAIKNTDMELVSVDGARESLEFYYKQVLEIDSTILENKLPNDNFYKGIK